MIEKSGGDLIATTGGGNIKADKLSLDKKLVLKTGAGNIKASLPSGVGMDLNIKGSKIITDLKNFTGISEKETINGTINGGGISVEVATSVGNVAIDFN